MVAPWDYAYFLKFLQLWIIFNAGMLFMSLFCVQMNTKNVFIVITLKANHILMGKVRKKAM